MATCFKARCFTAGWEVFDESEACSFSVCFLNPSFVSFVFGDTRRYITCKTEGRLGSRTVIFKYTFVQLSYQWRHCRVPCSCRLWSDLFVQKVGCAANVWRMRRLSDVICIKPTACGEEVLSPHAQCSQSVQRGEAHNGVCRGGRQGKEIKGNSECWGLGEVVAAFCCYCC